MRHEVTSATTALLLSQLHIYSKPFVSKVLIFQNFDAAICKSSSMFRKIFYSTIRLREQTESELMQLDY